jgi:methyl-accepting chemotaxis protein
VLGGITSSVDTELCQIVSCTNEIAKCVQEIADGAEEQNDAIAKTTTYVEQISANIDAVTRNAENARQAVGTLRNAASDSVSVVQTLIEGMDRIRANVSAGERKLRVLNDQAREIAAIIESIAAISSRTDLLALNASIESVRAGEHGRGFAVVAEEVHKLAEQAAQASRDAAALIHSTQLETHESIADLNDERARVEHDFQRVKSAREALEQIIHIASDSAGRVGEISHATEYQLQLAQDVVLAVERIANVAKGTRSRAEKACWTTKTLSKMARQFDTALVPLRRCLDPHPKSVLGTDLQEVLLESGESPAPRPKPIVDLGAAPGGSALHVTHAG